MTQTEWRNIPFDQKDLLIALPYRIGLWISHFDEQGDDTAEKNEKQALDEIVSYLARDNTSTPFVTDYFEDALRASPGAATLDCSEEAVLSDTKKAMRIIRDNVSDKDKQATQKALLTVAEVVAQAYGEFGEDDTGSAGEGWMSSIKNALGKLKGVSYVSMERPFNISPEEKVALDQLEDVLNEA